MKVPEGENSSMRLLARSETHLLFAPSKATSIGVESCPAPEPAEPNLEA
jgi:hypothetical protein